MLSMQSLLIVLICGGSHSAAKRIVEASGSQFDPAVVEAFMSRLDAIKALLTRMGKSPAPHPADITWFQEAI